MGGPSPGSGAGSGPGSGDRSGSGSGSVGVEARDPGLQPERTRLAWRRTTLSWTVVAVLGIKLALLDGATAAGLTGLALAALLWIAFLAVSHRRIRTLDAARPRVLSARGAVLAAGCTVALAVCGAVLIW
ncbi:DUF202 domain-containing protein [Streptomyces roseolus]|uniref:DUF202 domain-containing protein n=1 Tax=Streptomyces roseolus TaxID=67358 RepID=UPI001672B9C0|nr:DUF202 domain-containing protein [Streptomyces roseolus]GGR67139.1 hypothetical protein GCM10010282_70080 [Streptomyces roseolus]